MADAFDAAFGAESVSNNAPMQDAFDMAFPAPKVVAPPKQRTAMQDTARQLGLAARYGVEGVTALPSIVAEGPRALMNAGVWAANKLGGNMPYFPEVAPSVSNVLTMAGMPKPETPMERVVGDISRGVAGAGGSIGAGNALMNYGGQLSSKVGGVMAANPLMQGVSASTGTGAAGLTREAGGGPIAQMIAGIFGAVAPSAALTAGRATLEAGKKLFSGQAMTADDIQGQAHAAYKMADERGGILSPDFTNKVLDKIDDMKPKHEMGKLMAKDDPVVALSEALAPKRGKPVTLEEAHEFDKRLGAMIDGFYRTNPNEARRIYDIQTTFRQMIDDAAESDVVGGKAGFEALKEGRHLWSSAAKLRDIEKIITRAQMTDNPAKSIKTGFSNLYNNPARIKGYSDEQKELISKAAGSGIPTDILRIMGSRLNPIIGGSVGGLPAAVATQASSMAARGLATKLEVGRAMNVANQIAKDAVSGGVQEYKNALMRDLSFNPPYGAVNHSFLDSLGQTYSPLSTISTNRLLNPGPEAIQP